MTTLTDGVRRSLEDARDTAVQNIEYLRGEITKAEREIERRQSSILEWEAEICRNVEARDQANGMLDV